MELHPFANSACVTLSSMTHHYLGPILALSPMVLFLVLLELILILNIFALVHTNAVSVLELGGIGLASVQTVVELTLVTWNLLVTITAAHYE